MRSAYEIEPRQLREMRIYSGQAGVWRDKPLTGSVSNDNYGVAVGLLDLGSMYDDDFADTGLIYHYPSTKRVGNTDLYKIESVKNCKRLGIPVFAIRASKKSPELRDVFWGTVTNWDDAAEIFIIEFGKNPPDLGVLKTHPPFNLYDDDEQPQSMHQSPSRPGQAAFRIAVISRYGPCCAVCSINVIELLDAPHLYPKNRNGSDDPRNGLVLCTLHHRALDRGFFAIDPDDLSVVVKQTGPSLEKLAITRNHISHLENRPHVEALDAAWELFLNTQA
jgi:putative restriction endonuclease